MFLRPTSSCETRSSMFFGQSNRTNESHIVISSSLAVSLFFSIDLNIVRTLPTGAAERNELHLKTRLGIRVEKPYQY